MYHALGYSTIAYLQAMMTFEPVRISSLVLIPIRLNNIINSNEDKTGILPSRNSRETKTSFRNWGVK